MTSAELISALFRMIDTGLQTDDPSSVDNPRELLASVPPDTTNERHGASVSAYVIAVLYAASHWSTARLELASAVVTDSLGDAGSPLLSLLRVDSALASFRHWLVHSLSDTIARGARHPLLDEAKNTGMILLVLADAEELIPLFGGYLAQRADLPGELRAQGLVVASDRVFAAEIFALPDASGVLKRLGEPDIREHFAERVNGLGLGKQFSRYLVSLRPADSADAEGLIWLADTLLQRTQWIPDPGQLGELILQFARVRGKPAAPVNLVLNGLAIEAVKASNPRAAALWSLESYATEASLSALARTLHEACSADDREVAKLALTASDWNDEQLDDEERDQFLFGLLRASRLLGYDPLLLARIEELAERCVGQADESTLLRTGKYEELFTGFTDLDPDSDRSPHGRAELESAVFNTGFIGIEADRVVRFPYTEEIDLERIGPNIRFTIPHLTSRALRQAREQRIGPHGLLQLADCAVEMGDLSYATTFVSVAEATHPNSILVLLSRLKLAMHASRRSEARRYAGLLADELRANAATASTVETVTALISLPPWFFDSAPDIPGLFLADPRFSKYHSQLSERFH